ncbi:unnamed protein product, partial [Ectocarpus fasciculatus]
GGGWGEGRTRRQQCPEIKAARSWGRCSARRLTFYAPYWIVNKTGLALNYRARYPSKSTFSISPSAKSGGGGGRGGSGGRGGGSANDNGNNGSGGGGGDGAGSGKFNDSGRGGNDEGGGSQQGGVG